MSTEQFKTGTVTVTNGSAVVTADGDLDWSSNLSAGDNFVIASPGAPAYTILSVDGLVGGNDQLTLTVNYAGTTASGASYVVQRSYTTGPLGLPRLQYGASIVPQMFTQAMDALDAFLDGLDTDASPTFAGLTISGSSYPSLSALSSGAHGGVLYLGSSSQLWQIYSEGDDLVFYDSAGRVILKQGGDLGIGTTAPHNRVEINKPSGVGGAQLDIRGSNEGYGSGINFTSMTSDSTYLPQAKIVADGTSNWADSAHASSKLSFYVSQAGSLVLGFTLSDDLSVAMPGTVSMGALTTDGGLQTFGANDSGGAGYRVVLVPNA